MKKIIIFACLGAILCIALTAASPRFGWKLGGHLYTQSPFHYSGTAFNEQITDTYTNDSGVVIKIGYSNRLSRELTISCTNEDTIKMYVQMDRGSRGQSVKETNTHLKWVLYDIISYDSSGTFYYTYIKAVLVNILSFYLFNIIYKHRKSMGNIIKIMALSADAALFICSILISLRVIWLG